MAVDLLFLVRGKYRECGTWRVVSVRLLVAGEMLDQWIAGLREGKCIPETELKRLCCMVSSCVTVIIII